MVTAGHMTSKLVSGEVGPAEAIGGALIRDVRKVDVTSTLGALSRVLERDSFAVITRTKRAGVLFSQNAI